MDALIKFKRRNWRQDREGYTTAMWLLFLLQSSKPEPDIDGKFDLGTVDNPGMEYQRLNRETPYSVCKGIR
jgi:hypothetical protein